MSLVFQTSFLKWGLIAKEDGQFLENLSIKLLDLAAMAAGLEQLRAVI